MGTDGACNTYGETRNAYMVQSGRNLFFFYFSVNLILTSAPRYKT